MHHHHLKEKHQSGTGLQSQPVDINHPDQYFTITKEKGKKMPRFNTEFTWKEAVVVVFSFVSIEIVLSSKTLLAYSTVKGIMVFV
jgi:hypothetical protein